MRLKPTSAYCGLTIVMSQPSRFDNDAKSLLTGYAGQCFETFLHPVSRQQVDIRLASCGDPYLAGTKVIITLGEPALELFKLNPGLKPGDHLDNLRGTPIDYGEYTVIGTFNPQDSFDRKNYENPNEAEDKDDTTDNAEKGHQKTKRRNWKFWLYQDVRKAIRILKTGRLQETSYNYIYHPSINTILAELRIKDTDTRLFLDIETDREQNITCLGVSVSSSNSVVVIPWKRYNGTLAYEPKDCHKIIVALDSWFRSNQVVCHNGMFDWFVLAYKYKLPFPKYPFDTMIAWNRCYAEIEKSLGHLISYFTDCPYHKSDGVFDPHNLEQEKNLWTYNGKDVSRMRQVYDGLQVEIKRLGETKSVEQANRSIRPYLTMMFKGCKVDTKQFIKVYEECETRSNQLERCLKIITGRNLNPRSSQQVCKYLYEDLGFKCPDEENPTKEETLLKLLTKHECPSIKLILAIRGERKIASSLRFRLWNNFYDSQEAIPENGDGYNRATCAYIITGAETLRLGSRALLKFKPDPGWGTNMQNWDSQKSSKRRLIIPDKGKILGQTDQAGADAVIVAYGCCRPGRYRQLFDNKIKPHVYVAMQIFKEHWAKILDVAYTDFSTLSIPSLPQYKYWSELVKIIKADEIKYYIGKKSGHSFNYDQGANTFQTTVLKETEGLVVIPLADCKAYSQLYKFSLFPEIPEWHVDIQHKLKTSRKLTNLFGYNRRFHQPMGDDTFRKGYAFIPAATVACITHIAITELQESLEAGDELLNTAEFDMLQNGHDSILWQCKQGFEQSVASRVQQALGIKFNNINNVKEFKMGSETKVGLNWGNYHEVNNVDGLKEIKI